ncbi:Helicase conserved C-terminal domain-containing protein [Saccharopolyspora antimicrobica]|uniref:Helicase conserved C-terminal domain-containing protein n=1 Tax=Saccharopolyspora antimicrobica TaxID=455193 RepID=A0A1I4VB85_9PSEU|nr:helicase-associated domain-containing protein [Saccharopolyspora antimicrobica]RKT86207.1 XPB/Ssl2-like helicase family protein [Saccharopolyspora antimicrobica]SFM98448.1 Helicase conserved C-terminal domain-containing protein [Saccharopolyspora antimicrobica]
MDSDFVQWLRGLGRDQLTALLKHRLQSAAAGAYSLSRLAAVLDSPGAVESALQRLDAGCHEVLQALCVLDDGCTREQIEQVLGDSPELDRALRVLQDHGLIRPVPKGAIQLAAPLRRARTARLGRPVAKLLQPHLSNTVRGIAEALDLEPARRKADMVRSIEEYMQDPAKMTAELAKAPATAARLLDELVNDDSAFAPSFGAPPPKSPEVRWLRSRGFLIAPDHHLAYSGPFEVPREVGLVLRESQARPVLRPAPPKPPTTAVDPTEVDKAAALAATGFVDGVAGLLEHCTAHPIAMLQNGGVGVRVLKQLAKSLKTDQHEIRLWLETAAAGELLSLNDAGHLIPSNLADDWQAGTPAQRYVWLARTWWEQPAAAMFSKVVDKPEPAMLPRDSAFDQALRTDLVAEMADWEPGAALDEPDLIGEKLAWERPALYCCAPDLADPLQVSWTEAEAVGVIACGALSTLGRCVSDDEALLAAAAQLLPDAQETALLQADLSAVVAGTPSARLAATLNLMAEPEGRDTASTWRFSPESVRRAMDRGHSADDLLGRLAEIARADLPQPLEYLIKDVARRFGQLQVRTVQCCVLGEEPLLREVSANRTLRALSLQVLAPTVLASSRPKEETLAALRKAGYAPVSQDSSGTVVIERAVTDDRPPVLVAQPHYLDLRPSPPDEADLRELAEHLLAQPDGDARQEVLVNLVDNTPVRLGTVLAERTVGLSDLEVEHIRKAISTETEVEIEYRDQNGSCTTRVITPHIVAGDHLDAYCHLREEDRLFRLDRIRAVSPAPRRPRRR